MCQTSEDRRGVVALITVIIIGALLVTIGVTAAFRGQTDAVAGADWDFRNKAMLLAQTCVDEAAYRLKLNDTYVGGTIPLGADSCSVTVSGSGASRTVAATATAFGRTRTINVGLTRKQNGQGNARGWSVDSWVVGNAP